MFFLNILHFQTDKELFDKIFLNFGGDFPVSCVFTSLHHSHFFLFYKKVKYIKTTILGCYMPFILDLPKFGDPLTQHCGPSA